MKGSTHAELESTGVCFSTLTCPVFKWLPMLTWLNPPSGQRSEHHAHLNFNASSIQFFRVRVVDIAPCDLDVAWLPARGRSEQSLVSDAKGGEERLK